ncbi:MAG: HNH endonuclease [Acidimicrobiales bacterium]
MLPSTRSRPPSRLLPRPEGATVGEFRWSLRDLRQVISQGTAEYDHVQPWILGGRTETENGRPVHSHCHARGLAAIDGREAPLTDDMQI